MPLLFCGVKATSEFIFSSVSYAAHPLITDDSGTQGKDKPYHLASANFDLTSLMIYRMLLLVGTVRYLLCFVIPFLALFFG
jgi:hypothetical protein